jgi:hypothetical protein
MSVYMGFVVDKVTDTRADFVEIQCLVSCDISPSTKWLCFSHVSSELGTVGNLQPRYQGTWSHSILRIITITNLDSHLQDCTQSWQRRPESEFSKFLNETSYAMFLFYCAVYTQSSVVFRHGGTIMKDNKISCSYLSEIILNLKIKTKLHGLNPRANYTDRATAACWRSDCQLVRIEGATWSAWRIPPAVFSRSRYFSIK